MGPNRCKQRQPVPVPHKLAPIQSFGVYLAHYLQSNTFPEATSLDYAFIRGLQFTPSMLMAPPVTLVVRKLGVKPPTIMGIALQTAVFIVAAFATRLWRL
jgi:hypothetical protein